MLEPGGMLGEIVANKRRDVTTGLSGLSLEAVQRYAVPTRRSLKAALQKPGARFIMEVKRASPSSGCLAHKADAGSIALAYRGAADAISVLTDNRYFHGSLDDLTRVREYFDGPLLAKDFIVDVRQVPEARIHGADAVLVMLSVLSQDEARLIIREAKRLNMDVLVEAHDEREVRQAVDLGADIIGINNRDLKSFKVDLGVTDRLARLVPSDRLLVSESGISDRSDVDRLSALVDGFLVGSSLMQSENPALKARELAFGRVKVCGLTSECDALAAADEGASFGGLIFVADSPRAVSQEQAEPIVTALKDRRLPVAGVFRNEKVMNVALTAKRLGLDIVQLHGSEDFSYIQALRTILQEPIQIWAASAVGREPPRARDGADRTLLDSEVAGRSGGTGRTFDWSMIEADLRSRVVLAGGLCPANARAAAATGTWALDVGSGVEAEPGRKDPVKLRAFHDALRAGARSGVQPCN